MNGEDTKGKRHFVTDFSFREFGVTLNLLRADVFIPVPRAAGGWQRRFPATPSKMLAQFGSGCRGTLCLGPL